MSRPKAATFDAQKALIQSMAATLFAQKGFHNASMAELATLCQVSKPLLYHYYKDKEEILFDIANAYIERLNEITVSVANKLPQGVERLKALLAEFMKEYEHSQSQHIVLIQDMKFLGNQRRQIIIQKQGEVVDQFAATIRALRPDFASDHLDKPVTMILFGMINWTFTWLRAEGPLSYEQMGELATEIFLSGIEGVRRISKGANRLTDSVVDVS